jgi:hypothetical protein
MTENDTANTLNQSTTQSSTQSINKKEYWEELHIELQDLLAGYLDEELTAQEILLIEAHLVGCQHCRDDLERQQTLVHHVKQMPIENLTIDMYEKIQQDVSTENKAKENEPKIFFSLKTKVQNYVINFLRLSFSQQKFITVSGWLVTAMLLIYLPANTIDNKGQTTSSIPMITDALEQYHQLQSQDMPTTLIDTGTPATWENTSKLASWSTEIGGSPAQVFAVRYKDQIVLQYKVDQSVFFRNAKVRQAIAKNGWYQDQSATADILVLPKENSGLIIVGPKHLLPKREQIRISSI